MARNHIRAAVTDLRSAQRHDVPHMLADYVVRIPLLQSVLEDVTSKASLAGSVRELIGSPWRVAFGPLQEYDVDALAEQGIYHLFPSADLATAPISADVPARAARWFPYLAAGTGLCMLASTVTWASGATEPGQQMPLWQQYGHVGVTILGASTCMCAIPRIPRLVANAQVHSDARYLDGLVQQYLRAPED